LEVLPQPWASWLAATYAKSVMLVVGLEEIPARLISAQVAGLVAEAQLQIE